MYRTCRLRRPIDGSRILAHLTPTQRRAYVLADNKLALNAGIIYR
jgi:hypothetical protein